MSLSEAMASTDTGSSTTQTVSLEDAHKIPVTTPSYIQKKPPPQLDDAPYSLHLPFYPAANTEDEKATSVPIKHPTAPAPEDGIAVSLEDQLGYPVKRIYSETLEKPAWAAFQLGFQGIKAAYDFAPTGADHGELATKLREHTLNWLGEAVDYYSKPEENASITRDVTQMKARLADAAYHRNFVTGILGDVAESATDLIAMILPMGAAGHYAKEANAAASFTSKFAESTAKLGGYGFVRQNGTLSERGEAATSLIAYSLTPYIAQATGLTGLPVKGVAAALNVFVSSPTYLAEFQKTGGMNREFATLFIPKFVFDVGFAMFLKGLPQAEANARFKKFVKHQIKEMELPKAEAEKLYKDIVIAVESTPPEGEAAAKPADNVKQINDLKDRRHELMVQEVGILNDPTVKGRTEKLKIVRDRVRKLGFQIEKMEKGAKAEEPAADPLEPPVVEKTDNTTSEVVLEKNRKLKEEAGRGKMAKKLAETFRNASTFFENLLTPISSRLGRINPKLKARLQKFEAEIHRNIFQDELKSLPFLQKLNEMAENDRHDFDLALKNGDKVLVDKMVEKYDMKEAFDARTEVLAGIRERALQVGFDVPELANYHPRVVKDTAGFLQYLRQSPEWTRIDEAVREKQKEIGRHLSDDEMASYINALIRGKQTGEIGLSTPGRLKERTIQKVTPELNQFYHDSGAALLRHIYIVDNAIAARKFFGKAGKGAQAMDNIEGSIGSLVLELLQKDEISAQQAEVLSDTLKARFNEKGPGQFVGFMKNLAYIDVLGNPISAITQLQDVAYSLIKNGWWRTGKSILGGKLRKEDIFVSTQAQEFSDSRESAKAVKMVFRAVGFEAMDNFGKKTFINAAYERLQAASKNPDLKFMETLDNLFGEEASKVADDLAAGKVSENIRTLLFSELLNVQPLALSEMPVQYNRGGNGRVFYMLKSYTIKALDIYRRDVIDTFSTDPVQAAKNFTNLTATLVLLGVGTDAIKDFVLGRAFDLSDSVVNNTMKLAGFNRYLASQVDQKGPVRAAQEFILPPLRVLDSIFLDIKDGSEPMEWESIRSIPVGGELFYQWFGGGRSKIEAQSDGGANDLI